MTEDTVSVIIPAYNSTKFLHETLTSVLAQTHPAQHIFLVDDGSTDAIEEAITPFRNQIIFLRQANKGVSAARNLGATESTDKWLAFLDADDIWRKDKLEKQLASISKVTDNVALIYHDCDIFGEQNSPSWFALHPPYSGRVFKYLLTDDFMPMSSLLIRRDNYNEIGGFNEASINASDLDIKLRIASRWEVLAINEPLSRYRVHSDSLFHNRKQSMEEIIDILLKAVEWSPQEYSEVADKVERILAEYSFELGRLAMSNQQFECARAWFKKSSKWGENWLKPIAYLSSSYLPRALWKVLRQIKRIVLRT